MFLDQLTNADSMPVLQAAAQFAARRQKLIQSNIANISTPGYLTQDVSVRSFQEQLGSAVDARRAKYGGPRGELELQSTDEVRVVGGGMELNPQTPGTNILFHDRNNRDLERAMQDLSENVAMFRLATDLLKSRVTMMESAIRERP